MLPSGGNLGLAPEGGNLLGKAAADILHNVVRIVPEPRKRQPHESFEKETIFIRRVISCPMETFKNKGLP
jgi:hypothetical protein